MNTSTIRKKLITDINNANDKELKEIYNLHSLVKEEKISGITWRDLSLVQKEKINKAIGELNAGKGIPAKKVTELLNRKYGIQS